MLPVSVSSVRLTWATPTLTMLAVVLVEPMRVTSLIATVGVQAQRPRLREKLWPGQSSMEAAQC